MLNPENTVMLGRATPFYWLFLFRLNWCSYRNGFHVRFSFLFRFLIGLSVDPRNSQSEYLLIIYKLLPHCSLVMSTTIRAGQFSAYFWPTPFCAVTAPALQLARELSSYTGPTSFVNYLDTDLNQWSSTFLILWLFNTVPYDVVTPNYTITFTPTS